MPKTSTVGKILLQQHVPEALKSHIESTVLDSKGLGDFFDKASREHPVEYKDMVSQLTRLGFEVSTRLGSTVSLQDLVSPIDKDKKFAELEKKIEQLDATEKDAKKHKIALSKLFSDFTKEVETELVEVGVKKNQTLAKVIRAGARGKPMQYRQTVFSPILVNDAKDQPLTDFIIKNSYAEGLTLPEYLIGSFGARKGEVSKKLAVAEAGYFSKQLTRVGMVVKVEETDCGTHNGIPASTEDKDSVGCFLAHPIGSYHRNNEVTSSMLNDLKNKGIKSYVIRSVITCESSAKFHSGAVCQLCLGKRDHKNGTPIGSYVGITAANTIGEPLCLAKGTLVKMADFSSKPIEEVKVGEEILGADVTGKTFRTKVVNTFANGVRKCRTFNFQYSGTKSHSFGDNLGSVTCTDAHKILTCNADGAKLTVRAIAKSLKPARHPLNFTIVDTSDYFDAETYDLEVEHKDHLFCLANGLIVSNSQGQLNVKHTSGTAGGAHISSGYKLINNLANIPKLFPYEATLAEKDGTITDIRAAPQGGHYVHLAGKEYYTPSGYELTHKVGDHVEAGDALCSGIVNPAKIVLHKGVGEGRRYFAEATKKAFDDAGMGGINRRNFELMARGVIDHVKITNNEGLGDHLPGEIVHYQTLAKNYVHRPDSKTVRVDQAYDKYLEQPVLHYTIGDRITKSRIQQLKEHGIESILVNDKAPDFEPEMQRLLGVPIHEHDWMHQLYSTNLERRLVQAVNTGASSDLKGASPIAGLAYGVDFGKKTNVVKQAEFTTDEEENTEEPLSFE